jgi:hypothetical protein
MKLVITGVAAGGPGAARAHCRFVLPLIRFILDSLTYSVPLFLKGQCDRTLGAAAGLRVGDEVLAGEKQIRGSGGSLEPPGPLPMHLHTVYMEYSECLPTLLNPLAERTCFSQVLAILDIGGDPGSALLARSGSGQDPALELPGLVESGFFGIGRPCMVEGREVPIGLYPIVTSQCNSTALYQVSDHIQSLFF